MNKNKKWPLIILIQNMLSQKININLSKKFCQKSTFRDVNKFFGNSVQKKTVISLRVQKLLSCKCRVITEKNQKIFIPY